MLKFLKLLMGILLGCTTLRCAILLGLSIIYSLLFRLLYLPILIKSFNNFLCRTSLLN